MEFWMGLETDRKSIWWICLLARPQINRAVWWRHRAVTNKTSQYRRHVTTQKPTKKQSTIRSTRTPSDIKTGKVDRKKSKTSSTSNTWSKSTLKRSSRGTKKSVKISWNPNIAATWLSSRWLNKKYLQTKWSRIIKMFWPVSWHNMK